MERSSSRIGEGISGSGVILVVVLLLTEEVNWLVLLDIYIYIYHMWILGWMHKDIFILCESCILEINQ